MSLTMGEVNSRVLSQMGDSSQQIFSLGEIVMYSNDWLRRIAAQVPRAFWTTATITTANGTRTYSLATDWIRMIRVVYNDTDVLPVVTIDQLYQLTNDFDSTGTPSVYYVQRTPTGGTSQVMALMGLWPVPTSAVTIRYWYEYMPSTVASWTSRLPVPPGFSESIIPYVCWQLKKKDREFTEAERYKAEFMEGFSQLIRLLQQEPDAHHQMQSDQHNTQESFARLDPSVFENP